MAREQPAVEFRVVYRRVGYRKKARRFSTKVGAERFLRIFGPEPWTAFTKAQRDPDAYYCCPGRECGCGGFSVREFHERQRAELPPLEYARLEHRAVGAWTE